MPDLDTILETILQNYSNPPQHPNDVAGIPHNQILDHYQQFAQQASPDQFYQANQQYFQQIPPLQKQSLFESVFNALTNHGVNPAQAGVQGNNPTPNNYAQIVQYASQHPELLQSIFGQNGALSSPIAKMALAGALSIAAQKLAGR